MSIQLSRANTGTPLTTADYNSDNLIVETAVNSLLGASSSGGTVTNFTEVDTDTSSELFSASVSNPTTTPEITFSRISKAANLVYASPDGTSGKPTMRALVSGDLPVVPFTKGGTGITDVMPNNQVLSKRSGTTKYTGITGAGTARIVVTPTTDNFELDVVPANIEINTLAATTPLSFAKGGTNAATRQLAINALTDTNVTVNIGKALIVDGSNNATWTTFAAGVSSVNALTGAVSLITALIPESGNLYYTDTRVTNNATVVANTAKVTNATHTGDVTGSGALTIAAGVVTYAKMQAVSATKRILGRISGGAGSTEEIAISGNLAMSATDLIVRTSKIKTITANYSVPITEGTILVNGTSLTITLPDTSTVANGDEFIIKNIAGATTNSLVVFNAGIEEIDGSATYTGLNLAYNCVTVKYGGSNRWYIMSKITTG
jgi:hypothetical protein